MLRLGLALALLVAACRHRDPVPDAYDLYRRPDQLVAALDLSPGARVADVGAGAGYLTSRLARAVGPNGRVVATDIDRAALARLTASRPPRWVSVRAVPPDDPALETGAYDLVLLAEVDHLLPDRPGYLGKLAAALAPRGRLAVANRDYRRPGLLRDAARAGLKVTASAVELPEQFLVFLFKEEK